MKGKEKSKLLTLGAGYIVTTFQQSTLAHSVSCMVTLNQLSTNTCCKLSLTLLTPSTSYYTYRALLYSLVDLQSIIISIR